MDEDGDVLSRILAKAQLKSSRVNLDYLRTAYSCDSMRKSIRFGHSEIKECPRFLKRLEPKDIIAGRKAQLEVKVTGVPKPEVKWYKNWIPLQDGGNIQTYQPDPDHYVLNIYDAQCTDSGMYTCKARNDSGSVNNSAMIHVEAHDNVQNHRQRTQISYESRDSSPITHVETYHNVQNHKPRTKTPCDSSENDWSDSLSADLSRIRRQLRKLTEDFEQYQQIGLMHKRAVTKYRMS